VSSLSIKNIAMLKAVLLANGTKPGVLAAAEELRPEIERHLEILADDFTGKLDAASIPADLAIVFGGDGAILRAVNQLGTNQIPVLAVHLGTLGFLATLQTDELIPLLRHCNTAGGLAAMPVIEHLLLQTAVIRSGQSKAESQYLVLNETVLHAGHVARMISIELHIDGELVTTYRCDGLIISTPVGSTALNLSTGGPILRKDIDAVVVSPMSPHTLSNRPLVDSPDRCFELRSHQPAGLILDGDEVLRLEPGDTVRVTRAAQTFKTFAVPGFCYYKALRSKLGWNGSFTENE
jgi:NAD+ kinase